MATTTSTRSRRACRGWTCGRCEQSTLVAFGLHAARQFHILYPSLRQPHTSCDLSRAVPDSQADCRNAKDKADILAELEEGVGFDKCNALVVGLLREALLAQGRAAFVRLPAAERAGYVLFLSL